MPAKWKDDRHEDFERKHSSHGAGWELPRCHCHCQRGWSGDDNCDKSVAALPVRAVYKQWVHARRDALPPPALLHSIRDPSSDKDAAAAAEVNSTCRYCATPARNAESISATAVNEDSQLLLRRKVCWASEILSFLESEYCCCYREISLAVSRTETLKGMYSPTNIVFRVNVFAHHHYCLSSC